jgi:uncharacterized cupredoxin-like copper-binding protein
MTSKVCMTRATAIAGLLLALSLPAAAGQTVKVELWNKPDGTQGLTLTPSQVKAGEVTFEITNESTNLEHEFLIYKTDKAADGMPMNEDGAKIDEGKIPGFKEAGDLPEGASKTWSTELTPGKYLAFCNEEGHYMAGMHTLLTVTP